MIDWSSGDQNGTWSSCGFREEDPCLTRLVRLYDCRGMLNRFIVVSENLIGGT